MKNLFVFIIPLLIAAIPVAIQLGILKSFGQSTKKAVLISSIIAIVIGCFTPSLALSVSIYGLNYNLPAGTGLCATGSAVFWALGYVISLIFVPIVGIGLYLFKR